jgi:hypothetical protein
MFDDISGWIDPLIEFRAFTEFVAYAPRYGRLQDRNTVSAMAEAYYKPGGCKDLLKKCAALGTHPSAASFCYDTGVFCVSAPFPPYQGNPGQFIKLFLFSGLISKTRHTRDIMILISGSLLQL